MINDPSAFFDQEGKPMAEIGTATVTVTPEFSKDLDEMIREIVRDELNKKLDDIALRITSEIVAQSNRMILGLDPNIDGEILAW